MEPRGWSPGHLHEGPEEGWECERCRGELAQAHERDGHDWSKADLRFRCPRCDDAYMKEHFLHEHWLGGDWMEPSQMTGLVREHLRETHGFRLRGSGWDLCRVHMALHGEPFP